MAQQRESQFERGALITRAAVVQQIEARLAGTINDAALAAWAFDRFYAEELGAEVYEDGAQERIAAVLDALMFADDPSFTLDEEGLRDAIARLGTL